MPRRCTTHGQLRCSMLDVRCSMFTSVGARSPPGETCVVRVTRPRARPSPNGIRILQVAVVRVWLWWGSRGWKTPPTKQRVAAALMLRCGVRQLAAALFGGACSAGRVNFLLGLWRAVLLRRTQPKAQAAEPQARRARPRRSQPCALQDFSAPACAAENPCAAGNKFCAALFQALETGTFGFSNHWKLSPPTFPMLGKNTGFRFQCLENAGAGRGFRGVNLLGGRCRRRRRARRLRGRSA